MGYNAASSSSSSSSSLAPGFRFHPTDEELVIYYLKRKVCGKPFHIDAISEIDIYKFEPWDLPDRSRLKSRDLEWYFFSGLDKKYGNGWRTNRATDQGYWKTTGKDRPVKRGQRVVGMKKTLVFHLGRAPHGQRTNWVMHEYRLVDDQLNQPAINQDAFVLCRVFRKSGPGPKNGEQYGAPFLEEEWEWDDNELVPKTEKLSEGYCNLPNGEYLQVQEEEYKENPLVSMPQNDAVVGINGEDDCHILEKPVESSEGDIKVFIGTADNVGLPDEEMFNLSELFPMDQTPNENEYFSLDEFLNPEDDNNLHTEDLVAEELTNFDAVPEPAISNGAFVTLDDPNSFNADQNTFHLLDDYLQYFDDADINSNLVDLKSSAILEAGVPYLNDAVLTEEPVNTQNNQASLPLPESPGASSSENKPESPKATADPKYGNAWDNSIAKQVSRMLGSIPAPTAFAAEMPAKDTACRQNVAARSSSPVHVTAGMIHVSGMAVFDSEKMWSLGKGGNVDLLLPYGMTMRGMDLISSPYEGPDSTFASKATTLILRSGLYFMFLWVLLLSVSCKIGSYIYTR